MTDERGNYLVPLAIAVVVFVLILAGGAVFFKNNPSPTRTASPTQSPENKIIGNKSAKDMYTIIEANLKNVPPTDEEVKLFTAEAENKLAVIETDKGKIKFKFYPKDAPYTAASFIKLAQNGFYDGLNFHRVEPGFVIQGGDPLGSGTGGPGYNIKAEFNSQKHIEGTVAMARARDIDSAGSQFYIALAPQPFLDNQYTIFGQVIEGMAVVQKIQKGDKIKKIYLE